MASKETKEAKEIIRGSFDLETYGWDIAKGKTETQVNALCCSILHGPKDKEGNYSEAWIHDKAHQNSEGVVIAAMEYMFDHPEVDEWYAHNMGRFDGLFMVAASTKIGWKLEATPVDSRVIALEILNPENERKIKLRDTYNLVPNSLRNCAIDFDLHSKKLFQATDYRGDMRDLSAQKLREGCRIDALIVLELLERLDSLVGSYGGKLRATFSSTAIGIVRSQVEERGGSFPDFSGKNDVWVNQTCDKARYGGRVEVYHHAPKETLEEVDIRSSYPWSMAQLLPWKFVGRANAVDCLNYYDNSHARGVSCIVRASVEVPKQMYPPLPFKLSGEDKVVFFPWGKWQGWFVGEELEYAEKECGVKVTIHEGMIFESAQPFKDFIEKVYETKVNATGALRSFAKLTMNGCYGKFGESPDHQKLVVFKTKYDGIAYMMDASPGQCEILRNDERFLAVKRYRWSKHAHYAIAASITAKSRILHHRGIRNSVGPAYGDTDSVHCKKFNGKTGNALGDFGYELQDYRGEFFAPKIYRLTENKTCEKKDCKGEHTSSGQHIHLASKGFPVDAHSFDTLVLSGERRMDENRPAVQVDRMRLLRGQLRAGSTDVLRIRQFKRWSGMSQKRKSFEDGSTEPWSVKELERGEYLDAVSPLLG